MKISAFLGSARKDGNSATIVEYLLRPLQNKGHQVLTFPLVDLKIGDCLDCEPGSNEHEVCCQKDDFIKCLVEIVDSDILVFATPVHFGHVSGRFKTFLDRWCVFFRGKFSTKSLVEKKFVTVVTCASPAERFGSVHEYLQYWFTYFFKMKSAGGIIAGDLVKKNAILDHMDILNRAISLGETL